MILAPFAFARRPMLQRVEGLDPQLPVTIIYGSKSWIDSATGGRVAAARGKDAPTYVEARTPPRPPAPPTTPVPFHSCFPHRLSRTFFAELARSGLRMGCPTGS